jgi:hypothetical protein
VGGRGGGDSRVEMHSISARKRHSYCECSLRSSRACLGKMIIWVWYQMAHKWRFLTRWREGGALRPAPVPQVKHGREHHRHPLQKSPLFSQLSQSLSRAYLGKLIVFSINLAQKRRFPHQRAINLKPRHRQRRRENSRLPCRVLREETPLVNPYVSLARACLGEPSRLLGN